MHKFLIILILVSCSSYRSKKNENFADKRVAQYLVNWQKTNAEFVDGKFQKQYANYLSSVEEVFKRQGMTAQIDFYFDSLKNLDQSMAQENKTYDKLHAQNSAASKKTIFIIKQFDELLEERADKLLQFYGYNFYSELMKNRKDFAEKEKIDPTFPL